MQFHRNLSFENLTLQQYFFYQTRVKKNENELTKIILISSFHSIFHQISNNDKLGNCQNLVRS